jgi:hypothetical protein
MPRKRPDIRSEHRSVVLDLRYEPASPSQLQAWHWLWTRLLREDTGQETPPEAGTSATGSGGDVAYREALVLMQGRAGGLGG